MENLKKERRFQMLSLTRMRASMEELLKQKSLTLELISKMESSLETYYQPELKELIATTQMAMQLLDTSVEADAMLETAMFNELDKYRESKAPKERYEIVKKFRLCLICFDSRHGVTDCKSKFACHCGSRHSSLLHFEPSKKSSAENSAQSEKSLSSADSKSADKHGYSCVRALSNEFVVLPSVVIWVSCNGIVCKARALIDNCSQPNLVSNLFVRRNKLQTRRSQFSTIGGVGAGHISSSSFVSITASSRFENFKLSFDADVVPASSIAYTACFTVPADVSTQIRRYALADPAWAQEQLNIDRVDMIIGGKFFEQIVCDESFWVSELKLRRTQFGYTVAGVAPQPIPVNLSFSGCTIRDIDKSLRRYWELEEVNYQPSLKAQESAACLRHFEENKSFAEDNKFLSRLPFQVNRTKIASNRERALASFYHLERTLDPVIWAACVKFLVEYRDLHHMKLVGPPKGHACYIPYRPVLRESSTTTPCRVVFNASSHKKGELSLNDGLMRGPVVQRDLFDILISMRSFRFVLCADIKQMYRMVWIHEDDQDMQRIFFRENPSEPVRVYCLITLTYGTKSASFIATQCLQEVAKELENSNPVAAQTIRNCFYMDDLIAGANSFGELLALQKAVHSALAKRGFELRKYSSNCKPILEKIPSQLLAETALKSFEEEGCNQVVLGVTWNPSEDAFGIRSDVSSVFSVTSITKRVVLSYTSRIFDSMGLVSPITVRGKLLFQSLWLEGKSWDEPVSPSLADDFISYMEELGKLNSLVIPRSINSSNIRQIFGFCDASEKAYCAVVYLRSVDSLGNIFCRMICAKTRVAPVRSLTVPKLELAAASLLSELVARIAANLEVEPNNIFAFSDSTIVLCWLSQPAQNWKTFVCNRVSSILKVVPFRNWFYVSTENNPADFGTRGLKVREFVDCNSWFDGPKFLLSKNPFSVFKVPNLDVHNALERRKIKISLHSVNVYNFLDRFSSFTKMIRIVSYVLRFFNGCKRRDRSRVQAVGFDEFCNSLNVVIRFVQCSVYRSEVEQLQQSLPLKKKSSLISLNQFLDKNGVLRVGGRLEKSEFSDSKKHPIIVPAKSYFAKLLCRHVHEKYFHAGRSFMASYFSSQYWFVGGRTNLFKFVIRNCVSCAKARAKTCDQLMGQLPLAKVSISRPFAHCGVDFAGPFSCKCTGHRTTKFFKIYFAIFVCLTVRAVHIEIVSDLSTPKFIEALQRFISRRGTPAVIYSDNGTNFVGAKNFFELDQSQLIEFSTNEKFKWEFIPPRAPHFGGMWEAAVKSAKQHLMSVTHGVTLTFEEYNTLFARVEAVLNSRPICYKENVVQGSEVLTPAHFLIGRPMFAIPRVDDEETSLTNRLLLIRNQLRGFWLSWSKDYVNQLQQRSKWCQEKPNLTPGQLVLVRNENTKPFEWPLGIVEAVHPGQDGLVRVVDVRFQGSVKSRSVNSVVVLPVDPGSAGPAGGVC